MLKYERKLIDWLVERKNVLFFCVVTALALAARMSALDFETPDMKLCLVPWAQMFRENGGFAAMKEQSGDYNIFYQTLIVLLTRLPGSLVHLYKYVSITFDFLLALFCAWAVAREQGERVLGRAWNAAYTVVIFLPTVFLNSAVWGQCDAMYGFLCVLALYTLYKEHYTVSFIALGIGLALKLQTVFVIPVYLYVYISRKNFSLLSFLITAAVLWATGIPAYLQGRPLTAVLDVYLLQATEYAGMSFNGTTFWLMFHPDWNSMHLCAIAVTLLILGLFLYDFLCKGKVLKEDVESFLIVSIWSAWTCVLFLPGMHERYTYLADILLVVLALLRPQYRWYAVGCILISGMTYTNYLTEYFWGGDLIPMLSIVHVLLWLSFTFRKLPLCLTDGEAPHESQR